MYCSSEPFFQLVLIADGHCDRRPPSTAPKLLLDCTQFVVMNAPWFAPLLCYDEGFGSVLFIVGALRPSVRLALRQTRSSNRFQEYMVRMIGVVEVPVGGYCPTGLGLAGVDPKIPVPFLCSEGGFSSVRCSISVPCPSI